jgi:hypothetical protein
MKLTIYISETIRCVAKDLPKELMVERPESASIRQVAIDIGVPPILIVHALIDGTKKSLDEFVTDDAKICFLGTIAGG